MQYAYSEDYVQTIAEFSHRIFTLTGVSRGLGTNIMMVGLKKINSK
ncbi:hypothetical protein EZS27_015015 [termite gut metagenome]|uniref:Uncharacterized protein n=1 Tax=termite gut metagenome TaxID=433724 RepID=A0A5J4RSY2_9ZZZZ